MRKRWFAKREAVLKGTPYDSLFEKRMHETVLKDCLFHSTEHLIPYTIPHTYEPDFIYVKDGKTYIIETKGRFRDNTEASKYKWIRDSLPPDTELIFVWDKDGTRFPFAKKRKDGTHMTHNEWADKEGFRNWPSLEFDLSKL